MKTVKNVMLILHFRVIKGNVFFLGIYHVRPGSQPFLN